MLQPFFLSIFLKSPWVYWRVVKYCGAQKDELRNPTGSSTWRLGDLLTARYVYVPLQKKRILFEKGDPICLGFLFLYYKFDRSDEMIGSLQEKSSILVDGIDKEARNAQNECWNHNFFFCIFKLTNLVDWKFRSIQNWSDGQSWLVVKRNWLRLNRFLFKCKIFPYLIVSIML